MPAVCDDIDDIEDLIAAGDLKPSDRYNNKKDVIVRGRKEKKIAENRIHEKNSNGACESVSININTFATIIRSLLTCFYLLDYPRNSINLRENLGMFTQ